MSNSENINELKKSVYEGDEEQAVKVTKTLLDSGVEPMTLINQSITPGLDDIGDEFETGEAFLPELILSGDAAQAALDLILPLLSGKDAEQAVRGKVVIGTISGDAHDIGKNVVIALLAAYGLKIVDLGVNVTVRDFVNTAINEEVDIIAISSLITTSLPYQRQLIEQLNDRGEREKFFVIVGGGPVTPEWAEEIGADGYGRDAKGAVTLVSKLLEGKRKGKTPPLDEPIIVGALK